MAQETASRSIQTYNLFGEAGDLPDVVHCETIAARSAVLDWKITPHRHARLHQFLLIESGGGRVRIEDKAFALSPMRVVNMPAGGVHGYSFDQGTRGWVLTIAAEVLDQVMVPSEGLRRVLASAKVVRGTAQMRTAMKQVFAEFAGRRFARAHVLRSLTAMFAGLVAREMEARGKSPGSAAGVELFERFETLLEQHFLQHWTVSQYAGALSVTPTHLSRVTRAATGHAASRLIAERIVREARRNLAYTHLPVSTIAYSLGFNDPAYFSRLFSEATGLSPRRFREKVSA
jgi:AraC family transcriptional regulator, transcriptional activator of pobA